jgi:hypothetical protein
MVVHGTLPRGFKPTPEQTAYRVREAIRLLKDGCTPAQIAAAMTPRVHEGTIRRDAHLNGVRWVRRISRLAPDPAPIDWLHPPVEREGPSDRPALAVGRFLAEMEAARWEPAHAHDLLDARLHGDHDWEKGWLDLVRQLRQMADGLGRLHTDSGRLRATALGRERVAGSKGVDELRQGGRGGVHAVEGVVDESSGPRRLGGDVEDQEEDERPGKDLLQHSSRVTLTWPAVDGVRV